MNYPADECAQMDAEVYLLKAASPEHGLHDVTLNVYDLGEDYRVSCELPLSGELLTSDAGDCFAALQVIRRKAEGRGWSICCKGARRNVWPSAMSRQMGGGVKAYILEMGRQGRADELVEIFEEDSPELYATVADQESFAMTWFDSLK